jgi:hypothetical protein
MKRNVILTAILTLFLTVSSVGAQEKAANFLGSWKLAETGNKGANKFGVESVTISVSEADGKLIIERSGKYTGREASSSTEAYKIDEDTEVSVIGGFMGGVQYRSLRFLTSDKLQFLTKLNTDVGQRLTRATWKLSEDGKTLTVKQDYRTSSLSGAGTPGVYLSSKQVFTKQ